MAVTDNSRVSTVSGAGTPYPIVTPNWEVDYIQGRLAQTGTPYEYEMLELIRSLLGSTSAMIDVGANVGNHSLYALHAIGCSVIVFEPNAELCAAIRESAQIGGMADRLTLHEIGLGDADGRGYFGVRNTTNFGGQSISYRADSDLLISTLDGQDIHQKIDLIKIDVEGMEGAALRGAVQLIDRDHPHIFVECHDVDSYSEVSSFLAARGYVNAKQFNATPTHYFLYSPHTPKNSRDHINDLIGEWYEKEQQVRKTKQAGDCDAVKYRALTVRQEKQWEDHPREISELTATQESAIDALHGAVETGTDQLRITNEETTRLNIAVRGLEGAIEELNAEADVCLRARLSGGLAASRRRANRRHPQNWAVTFGQVEAGLAFVC